MHAEAAPIAEVRERTKVLKNLVVGAGAPSS